MCKIFNLQGLKIAIEANIKSVNFLDINLDLNSGVYKPFMKPNDTPLYVHKLSNHPKNILTNIPLSVNKRLSCISSNETVFKEAISPYQEALNKTGYQHQLIFDPPANINNNNLV